MARGPRAVAPGPYRTSVLVAACLLATLIGNASGAGPQPAVRGPKVSRSWVETIKRPWGPDGFFGRLYERLSSNGFGSGTWRERRDLDAGLTAFAQLADGKLQDWDSRAPRYKDPLLREVRATLIAVMAAQRGNQEAAEKAFSDLVGQRPVGDQGRLLGEVLVVLSDGRSQWQQARPWCESSITDRKHGISTPHLIDSEEFLYACARAASFAGDWSASARAAAAVAPESDFAPFAWYAAGSAAARGEQLDLAVIAFEEVVRNFEAWLSTQRDESHRRAVIAWSGGRDLVRDWALAALVYVHEQAGQPAKARAAFRRIKVSSPVYGQALSALTDDDATIAFAASTERTWADAPEAAITYSQWLSRNGHELLAGRILEDALRKLREEPDLQSGEVPEAWAKDKIAIEHERIEREKSWRQALVQRARRTVGSFFTDPVKSPPSVEATRPFEGSLRATRDATGTYLRTAALRQPLRNCVADEGDSPRCGQMAASTLPGALALATENRRRDLYAAEQLLSQALLAQTEELARIGDGTASARR